MCIVAEFNVVTLITNESIDSFQLDCSCQSRLGSSQAEESRHQNRGSGGGTDRNASSGTQNREASTIHARKQKGSHGLPVQVVWLILLQCMSGLCNTQQNFFTLAYHFRVFLMFYNFASNKLISHQGSENENQVEVLEKYVTVQAVI